MTTLRLRPDLEAALRQIQGVRAASVVTTGTGEPSEIHVLAATGKTPKQVVRDVQSLAMARFDLDIDHRIVSVVQLDDVDLETPASTHRQPATLAPVQPAAEPSPTTAPQPPVAVPVSADASTLDDYDAYPLADPAVEIDLREPTPVGLSVVPDSPAPRHAATGNGNGRTEATARVMVLPEVIAAEAAVEEDPGPRPSISSIMLRTSGDEVEATVALAADGTLFEAQVVGPAGTTHRARLVAQATVQALSDLLGQPTEIESASIVDTGARRIALTVLTVMTPRIGEQVVTGSALVRGDDAEAIARSVLDALNRRLSG